MQKRAKLNNNSKFVKSLSVAALAGLSFWGAGANAQDTDRILTDRIIVTEPEQTITGTYENRKWNGGDEWWSEWSVMGGVVKNTSTDLTIENAEFKNNAVYTYGADWMSALGGAVANDYGATIKTIKDTVFEGNRALNVEPGVTPGENISANGGALYNAGIIQEINNTTFKNNIVSTYGSAIFNNDNGTIANIKDSTFTSSGSDGGIVYNYGGTIGTIENTKFNNLSSPYVIANQITWNDTSKRGLIELIKDCEFENNGATIFLNAGGDMGNIENSTFRNNTGQRIYDGQTNLATGERSKLGNIINSTFEGGRQEINLFRGDMGYVQGSTFTNSNSTIFNGIESNMGVIVGSTFKNINGSVINTGISNDEPTVDYSTVGSIINSTFDNVTNNVFTLSHSKMGDIINSEFTNNKAYVISIDKGTIGNIINSKFDNNNYSVIKVGSIDYNTLSMGSIRNSTFTNNKGSSVIDIFGMSINGIYDSEFSNNNGTAVTVTTDGYYYENGRWTQHIGTVGKISNTVFDSNNLISKNGTGVLYLQNASVDSIDKTVFSNNYGSNASVIYNHTGNIIGDITNSEFIDNIHSSGSTIINQGQIGNITNTIFKGNKGSNTDGTTGYGGAINNPYSGNTIGIISNSTFEDNAAYTGGAIFNDGQIAGLDNVIFKNNTAAGNGGAVFQNYKIDYLKDLTFENNTANGGHGGAMYYYNNYNTGTPLVLEGRNIFKNNSATAQGGAIWVHGQIGDLSNALFQENKSGHMGGAIASAGIGNISNTAFIGNESVVAGGAISVAGNPIGNIINSYFEGNKVSLTNYKGTGGAISNENNEIGDIIESTFKNNEAKHGGAIFTSSKLGNIEASLFQDNYAEQRGGALNVGSISKIDNSNFINNSTNVDNGGAIYTYEIREILNSNFVGNKVKTLFNENSNYGYGGAIYLTGNISSKISNIENTRFQDNYAGNSGGAIFSTMQIENIKNSEFTNNTAHNNGGAILEYNGNINIEGSSFKGNKTENLDGGAIYTSGYVTLTDSEFLGNEANGNGGALYILNGLNAQNVTFDGNKAVNGEGGTIRATGVVTLDNVSVKNTESVGDGGAILAMSGFDAKDLTIDNAISKQGKGGGVFTYQNLTIDNGLLTNISANSDGGALYSCLKTTLIDTTIYNTSSLEGNGGGVFSYGGVKLENSQINNATAGQKGGAIYVTGSLDATGAKIYDNTANSDGGALYVLAQGRNVILNDAVLTNNTSTSGNGGALFTAQGAKIDANNATIVNNKAENGNGGALYLTEGSTFYETNATIVGNNAKNGRGGAIYVDGNYYLEIKALDGDTIFDGNTDSTGANDIYFNNTEGTSASPLTGRLSLNAQNGNIVFNGTIEAANPTLSMGLGGNDTGHIYLNGNVINAQAVTEGAINLHLGVDKEKGVSNIFAHENDTLIASQGTVHMLDNQTVDYNINRFVSGAKFNIDVDWDKEKGDRIVMLQQYGGGNVNLQDINIIDKLGEYKDKVIVQIIKNSMGNPQGAAHVLTLDYFDSDNFEGVYPYVPSVFSNSNLGGISDEITLETTDTYHDSIGLRGYRLNTLEYISSLETKDGDKKTFTFTKDTPTYTYDGDEITVTGDLTIQGEGEKNYIDFSNKTTLKTDQDAKLTIKNSSVKNTKDIDNEGTLQLENAKLTDNITNNGNLVFAGSSNDITSEVNGNGNVTFKEGNQEIKGKFNNQNLINAGANTTINNLALINDRNNSLNMISGNFNIPNLGLETLSLNALNMKGGNLNIQTVDVDLANQKMGNIVAKNSAAPTGGSINVNAMNILSDAKEDTTKLTFAQGKFKDAVNSNVKEAYTPIYRYDVNYDRTGEDGLFTFTRGAGSNNDSTRFNPAVLTDATAVQAGGQTTMNNTFMYAFEHADVFSQLPSVDRFAKINSNKYAIASTDFNSNLKYNGDLNNQGVWVKPYSTFENIKLKNGPKVNTINYGTLIGFDSDFHKLKHGWANVGTAYIGYSGSQMDYKGVDASMNSGLIGLTETFYKGNFWTALTATAGAGVAEAHTMYGKDDITMLMAGIGSKTGYNLEFKEGKFIVQPRLFMSYSFVNSFDYTNSAGVRIDSDPMHTVQINPSIRFIGNTKGGWQPYASVGMVWNLLNETNATADGVKLPEMHTKPYVEYGVGLQRTWADKFSAYGQAMLRHGGRNGVALTFGFRWAIGKGVNDKQKVQKDSKMSGRQEVKRACKTLSHQNETATEGNRKVLKQLSPTQKAHILNTTRTSMNAAVEKI